MANKPQRVIEFYFDQLPPSLNGKYGLLRMHWAARGRLQDAWTLLVKNRAQHLPESQHQIAHCQILFTLYVRTLMDWDNAYARFKILGDALVAAGVISDDSPSAVEALTCDQLKVRGRDRQGCAVRISYR